MGVSIYSKRPRMATGDGTTGIFHKSHSKRHAVAGWWKGLPPTSGRCFQALLKTIVPAYTNCKFRLENWSLCKSRGQVTALNNKSPSGLAAGFMKQRKAAPAATLDKQQRRTAAARQHTSRDALKPLSTSARFSCTHLWRHACGHHPFSAERLLVRISAADQWLGSCVPTPGQVHSTVD